MSEPRYALDDFNQIAAEDRNGDHPDHDSWTPILLSGLPDQPPVQPTLGGVGLVYPGKRHVFSGPQESAKTLAAYAIGIHVVRAGGTTMIIDFEMGAWDARNRLQELGATNDELDRIPYLEPHHPATDDRVNKLAALNPDLVIVDAAAGAYDLQGLDDNKRQDVGKISRLYVDRFWKAGIATIILDHVVKNREGRGTYAIGSERKVGGADVHLGFETITPIQRGSSGLYKIVTHKDRGGFLQRGRLADLHLTSDPDTHRISWEFKPVEHEQRGDVWMPTIFMEKISTLLESSTEPISRNQLELSVSGNNDQKRAAIDHLVRLKYVQEDIGKRNARLYTSLRRFTVSEWEKTGPDSTSPDLAPTSPRRGAYDFASSPLSTEGEARSQANGRHDLAQGEDDDPEETARLMSLYVNEPEPSSWIDDLTEPERDPDDDLPL
jgi:hypothetical protein